MAPHGLQAFVCISVKTAIGDFDRNCILPEDPFKQY